MASSFIQYTQKIRGFQHKKYILGENNVISILKRKNFVCPFCGSKNILTTFLYDRTIQGLPIGCCNYYLKFSVHRIYCHNCHKQMIENFHFLSHPKSRITKELERTIVELRKEMSIHAIAKYFNLRWHTIKEVEKRYLQRKFQRIQVGHVKIIGIDEIYVSSSKHHPKYLTIIRDLQSGAVIHVGDGKGISALQNALKRLKKSKLRVVTMDMSNAYSSWFAKHFPKVKIVFDHFHVIKLMNDKVDLVRRRISSKMSETQRKEIKGLRFVFLKNNENIDEDCKQILKNMRGEFQELGDAYMFKEALRSIYAEAPTSYHARKSIKRWCQLATSTKIPELISISKTLLDKIDGIVTYWTYSHLSNASMEGFNNKIRWLIRQAYGFRDREYFKLKIYELATIQAGKKL